MAVVGVDFGTLNAVMAQAERGGVKVLLNENSKRLNANMVSFQGKQRFLGEAAASVSRTNYKNTVKNIKRLMGRKFSEPELQEELKNLPGMTFVEAADGYVGVEIAYDDGRKVLTMPQVAAMMMFRMSQICQDQENGATIADVVVSCPAWFGHSQRLALLDACDIAQVKCLRLMHDTTATALEYGIWRSLQKAFDDDKASRVLFVDLGYSSLQVSVVDYVTGKLTVKATTWDRNLGGRDFDMEIAKFVAAEFEKKHKQDAMKNPKSLMKLLDSCEKAKKTLSPHGVGEANLYIESLGEDLDFSMKLTLEKFEELVEPLLEKLIPPVKQALEESGTKDASELFSIEVVGGGTRVGSVKKKLADFLGVSKTGSPPNWGLQTTLNADECVSKGLAMQAAILSPRFKVKDYQVVEAVPYSINFSWEKSKATSQDKDSKMAEDKDSKMDTSDNNNALEDEGHDADDGSESTILFPRNSETPFSKRIVFKRTDDIKIQATYAASDVGLMPASAADAPVADFDIQVKDTAQSILNNDAEIDNAKVRLTFKHTIHGTVEVSSAEFAYHEYYEAEEKKDEAAKDDSDSKKEDDTDVKMAEPVEKKKRVKRTPLPFEAKVPGKMTRAQMNDALENEAQMAQADRIITETNDMRNEVEAYIYRMRDELVGDLRPYVSDAEKPNLETSLAAAEEWLYEGDGFDTSKSNYSSKLSSLQNAFQPADARKKEEARRPELVAKLTAKMEDYKKWCNNTDGAYAHISDDDKAKVRQCADDTMTWLMDMLDKQGSAPQSADPLLKCYDIRKKLDEAELLCKPIMNTPKPKVEEKKAETKDTDMPDAAAAASPDVDMPDAQAPPEEEEGKKAE